MLPDLVAHAVRAEQVPRVHGRHRDRVSRHRPQDRPRDKVSPRDRDNSSVREQAALVA